MRNDIIIRDVIDRCEALKRAQLWPSEPRMRPRAWLENFDDNDKIIAASLLDKFTFCNEETVNSLLYTAWHSIGDGLQKGPDAPTAVDLISALTNAVFTPIESEDPNRTDSGNLMCRKARQILKIDETLVVDPKKALELAKTSKTVVFFDDFVGSGDQFISTWNREYLPSESFLTVQRQTNFTAIYITLITTDYGLENIHRCAPTVAVCPTHTLTEKSTVRGLIDCGALDGSTVCDFLNKYSDKLRPPSEYIAGVPRYRMWGYKERGLLLGFEHSIPDATLPIFWSPGVNDWCPLIERT